MSVSKTKCWAIVALVSVALNLFMIGLIAGRVLQPEPPMPDRRPFLMLRSARDLAPRAQQIVNRTEEQYSDRISESINQVRQHRQAAIDALCAPQFDEPVVREQFVKLRDVLAASHDVMHESMIAAAKQMRPEERKQLYDAMMRDRGPTKRQGRKWRQSESPDDRPRGPKGDLPPVPAFGE